VVYRAAVRPAQLAAVAGKRLEELAWVDADAAASDRVLAFDHAALVGVAVEQLRSEVRGLPFPAVLVDEHFTLGELQAFSEAMLGEALDKSRFRRRLDAAAVIEAVPGEMRTGPNRPAQAIQVNSSVDPGSPPTTSVRWLSLWWSRVVISASQIQSRRRSATARGASGAASARCRSSMRSRQSNSRHRAYSAFWMGFSLGNSQ
jgi:hypothetical protein